MELIFDSNVVIDFLARREPFYAAARKLILLAAAGEVDARISTSMLTDIYYIASRNADRLKAQEAIEDMLSYIHLIGVDPEDVKRALACRWTDFEDCLVYQCAKKVNADFIVTRNVKDFARSPIPAISPDGLLEEFARRGRTYEEIDW